MQKSLGLDGSRFVVDPDVDGKWDRVAFEAIGSRIDCDRVGDLVLGFEGGQFVGQCGNFPPGDHDQLVVERIRCAEIGKTIPEPRVSGPGLVEVNGDGEVFGHCKQNEVNPDESESKQTAIPRTIYASSSKCLFES